MLSTEAKNRINQLNPWFAETAKGVEFLSRFLPKEYVHRASEDTPLHPDRALLIIGPRQSGKSTLAWHMLQSFAPNVLFLNMEDPLLRMACKSPVDFVEAFNRDYRFAKALFIDEAQHMEEAGLFVKGLVDARLGVPILVTGSSSFHLASRTRESLAGRATRQHLLPFSLAELLNHAAPTNPVARSEACRRIIDHQLILGSYPAVYLEAENREKVMLLNDLVDALILRDASDLFRIKRIDAFRKLLALLAGQIGNLLNLSELASVCNVDVGTISSYIEILQQSHVIRRVQPYAGGKRREITGTPKVFYVDNGIRNQLTNNFSGDLDLRTDKGQLLENWVFSEIAKRLPFRSSLKFWRSKAGAEVDFVIEHGEATYAVEVKSAGLKRPQISRSARSFIEAYRPQQLCIVNTELEQTLQVDQTIVQFLTPCSLDVWLDQFKI